MKRTNKILTFCTLAMLVSVLSCGHPMSLQSITITPTNYTVTGTGPGLAAFTIPYHAYGHFIHPTETVDITNQVTWSADATEIADFNATPTTPPGVITPTANGSCGIVDITATAGKLVIGPGSTDEIETQTATFTVNDTSNPNCGGIQTPTLAVDEINSGTVSSTPVGINCTDNGAGCSAAFTTGTPVLLIANAPATFSPNCTTESATSCEIVMSSSAIVTVTF